MGELEVVLEWLQFWKGHEQVFTTFLLYTVGIAAYTLVIYGLYQNICRKSLVAPSSDRLHPTQHLARLGRFLLLFPLMTFAFFLALTISLMFLSKTLEVPEILLLTMAVIGGVRATAYVNESASHDLAKLVPLGLLGVALVQPGFLSLEAFLAQLVELWTLGGLILRYFLAILTLEIVLKLLYLGVRRLQGSMPLEEPVVLPEPQDEPIGEEVPVQAAAESSDKTSPPAAARTRSGRSKNR